MSFLFCFLRKKKWPLLLSKTNLYTTVLPQKARVAGLSWLGSDVSVVFSISLLCRGRLSIRREAGLLLTVSWDLKDNKAFPFSGLLSDFRKSLWKTQAYYSTKDSLILLKVLVSRQQRHEESPMLEESPELEVYPKVGWVGSLDGALAGCTKPRLSSPAPYKQGIVVHSCHPCSEEDQKFKASLWTSVRPCVHKTVTKEASEWLKL